MAEEIKFFSVQDITRPTCLMRLYQDTQSQDVCVLDLRLLHIYLAGTHKQEINALLGPVCFIVDLFQE